MADLDILFLGMLFPRDIEQEIKSKMKSGMQDAANALQWNLIDGLDANHCGTIRIVTYLPVDSYPRGYTQARIRPHVFQHSERYRSEDRVVGCTNLTVVKQFANQGPFRRVLKSWARDGSGRRKVLLLYSAEPLFLSMAKYIKTIAPEVQTCCVIADLPEFSCARTLHGLLKLYNDYQARRAETMYRYMDRFVLLTRQMADRLRISVPYMVMEGIAPEAEAQEQPIPQELEHRPYILYTGTLNYAFGIGTLLEAFSQIADPTLRLVICGFGEAQKAILASADSRIVYLGRVDRSQALALQRRAAVLVNPRQNNEEFTKYSFPSKTMEYLASGVPVVAYKLDGIPAEYDAYIHYVPDNTPQAMARELYRLLALPAEERRAMGQRARDFVLTEKNAKSQTKRILDFLTEEN